MMGMNSLLRSLASLVCAAALTACGQPAPSGGQTNAAEGPVVLATTQNMPDWLLVARQRDCPVDAPAAQQCPLGEVHFNQRTITRTADGFADIWVQASHGQPQLYEYETDTTRTTVRFQLERLHYRFNCTTQDSSWSLSARSWAQTIPWSRATNRARSIARRCAAASRSSSCRSPAAAA